MTYATKQNKNGKIKGYLIFDSGKRLMMNHAERAEFEEKVKYWMMTEKMKETKKENQEMNENKEKPAEMAEVLANI